MYMDAVLFNDQIFKNSIWQKSRLICFKNKPLICFKIYGGAFQTLRRVFEAQKVDWNRFENLATYSYDADFAL